MTVIERRGDMSRCTLLALLLGVDLGADAPVLLDGHALERLLAWARNGADGPLDLRDAPLDPAHLAVLPRRLDRLDASLLAWTRDGTWVIGRDDPSYPRRLRRRLGAASPLLLFGRGDPALPGRGGVAVVCGANAGETMPPSLRDALGDATLHVVSRHADQDAISIVRAAAPAATAELRLRPARPAGIATTAPGPNCGDAAALDACCYGLADTVVVSGLGRSDAAWPGIAALIAADRQPVWVDGPDGDAPLLIRMGARPIPPDLLATGGAGALLLPVPSSQSKRLKRALGPAGTMPAPALASAAPVLVRGFAETQAGFGGPVGAGGNDAAAERPGRGAHLRLVEAALPQQDRPTTLPPQAMGQTLYELFQERLAGLLAHGPLGAGRIAEAMDLTRQQVDAWLLRAEAQGAVRQDPQTRLYAGPPG